MYEGKEMYSILSIDPITHIVKTCHKYVCEITYLQSNRQLKLIKYNKCQGF